MAYSTTLPPTQTVLFIIFCDKLTDKVLKGSGRGLFTCSPIATNYRVLNKVVINHHQCSYFLCFFFLPGELHGHMFRPISIHLQTLKDKN
jgi:hypothetical protein